MVERVDRGGIFDVDTETLSEHWRVGGIPGGGSRHPRGDEHTYFTGDGRRCSAASSSSCLLLDAHLHYVARFSRCSLYDWEGAREAAAEVVLIAKTTAELAPRARDLLEHEHSYNVPAILTLPLTDMNPGYRDWLLQSIRGGT